MNRGWDHFGGVGLAAIAFLYGVAFTAAGAHFYYSGLVSIRSKAGYTSEDEFSGEHLVSDELQTAAATDVLLSPDSWWTFSHDWRVHDTSMCIRTPACFGGLATR